jgi:probable HAF family extracellular repeat protein
VNNRGQVAVVSYTSDAADPATGVPQLDPFLWEDGRMKDLGNLGGTNAFLGPFIYGLNNRGEVAGVMALAGDRTGHAFLWNGKKLIDLETLGGSFSGATGLNDSGEVIGYAALPGDAVGHGFLWQNGVIHDLPPVDGDVCSLPLWINAKGQVAGNSSLDCNTDLHAVLWNDGIAIDLNQFLPPGSGIQLVNAVEITDDGIIAGAAAPPGVPVNEAESRGHAFLLIPCEPESSPDCADQTVNDVRATTPAPSVQSNLSPFAPGAVSGAQAYIKTRMRHTRYPKGSFEPSG